MDAEEKARAMIAARTTYQLIADFEETDKSEDANIPIVRGWLMDELEKRNPEAFDAWLETNENSPRQFFVS